MKPIVGATLRIHRNQIDIDKVRKDLTVRYSNVGELDIVHELPLYTQRRGIYYLPRQYGLKLCKKMGVVPENRMSIGYPLPLGLKSISLRDEQVPWVDEVVNKFKRRCDVFAQAGVGKGKTVMSLEISRRLGVSTLIIVDQEFLRDQWIREIKDKLGATDNDIGIVQGETCSYRNKPYVVAMIQTLFSRHFTKEFFNSFGLTVFDEAHVAGAPVFSRVLSQISSRYRLEVSATPKRRDALQKTLDTNCGKVCVKLETKHRESIVRVVSTNKTFSWYANVSSKTGRYLQEIANDGERNVLLCEVMEELHATGRSVLGVSDRVEHLGNLKALLVLRGKIPAEDIGVCAGYETGYKYAKDPKPKRMPPGYTRSRKHRPEYSPVCMSTVRRRIPRAELEETKNSKKVILATYGMFEKGVDVPHLGSGIELTPRSRSQQVQGRILRTMAGKLVPIWVTVRDRFSYRAEHQLANRIPEYLNNNAVLQIWKLGKGIKRIDPWQLHAELKDRVKALKGGRIITKPDGRHITLISPTARKRKRGQDAGTGKKTPSSLAS